MSIATVNSAIKAARADKVITLVEARAIVDAAKKNVKANELAAILTLKKDLGVGVQAESKEVAQTLDGAKFDGRPSVGDTVTAFFMLPLAPLALLVVYAMNPDSKPRSKFWQGFATIASILLVLPTLLLTLALAPLTVTSGLVRGGIAKLRD